MLLTLVTGSLVSAQETNAIAEQISSQAPEQGLELPPGAGTMPIKLLSPDGSGSQSPDGGFGSITQPEGVPFGMDQTSSPADGPSSGEMLYAQPGIEGAPAVPGVEGAASAPSGQTGDKPSRNLWRIRPVLGVGYVHDDNVFISNSNPVSSGICSLTGGFTLDFGDYREMKHNFLTLSYIGTGYLYNQIPSADCYNQTANFIGQYAFERLRIQEESAYAHITSPNREIGGVGNLTTSILYNNALKFLYEYSLKTRLEFELHQISNLNPGYLNTYYNEAKLGGDYLFTQKFSLGLEGILGSNPTENSPTRYYQTLNGRVHYDLTGKMALKATGGIQCNEFPSGGVPMRATPVLSLGADYKLFSDAKEGVVVPAAPVTYLPGSGRMQPLLGGSSISLLLYRNQQASTYYNGQNILATGGEVGLNKTFGRHLSANISVGYENDAYIATQQGVQADRTDNYFFFKPSLTYRFLKYYDCTIFYEHSMNDSTIQYFTWVDSRFGLELKTSF
jgi:hypothetical protein